MSHVAYVEGEVKDLDALDEALLKFPEAKAALNRNQKVFRGYGSERAPCLHAISMQGMNYEIGLRLKNAADPDTYQFAADFYSGELTRAFGPQLVHLRNEYMAVVAENALRQQGYMVTRYADSRQRLELRAQ